METLQNCLRETKAKLYLADLEPGHEKRHSEKIGSLSKTIRGLGNKELAESLATNDLRLGPGKLLRGGYFETGVEIFEKVD